MTNDIIEEITPELFPLVPVCFVAASVSAAHLAVLAVLVSRTPGEDGGTEAGQLVIHGADPERELTS